MKSKTTLLGKPCLRFAGIIFAVVLTESLPVTRAASLYWDGNSTTAGAGTTPTGTWGTSNFWNTDSTGGAGTFSTATSLADDLFFSAGTDATGSPTITVSGTQSAKSLTFDDGAAVTLSGGTAIQLGSGGITVNSGITGGVTISSSLTLEASQTWANNSTKNFIINTSAGTVDSTLTSPVVVTIADTGTGGINIQSNVLKDNNAAGGSTTSLVVDRAGSTAVSVNAVQGYSGGTTIKQGTFRADIAGAAGTGTVYLGDTTGNKSATLINNGINLTNNIVVQAGNTGTSSLTALNANPVTFSGTITLDKQARLNANAGSSTTTLSGLVSGVGGILKDTDTHTLILTHANTFSGGISFNKGVIQIGDDAALGTGTLTFNNNNGTVSVATTIRSTDATARTIGNVIGTFGSATANYVYAFGASGTGSLTFTNTTAASLNGVNRIFQVDSNTSFANGFTSTNGAITKTGSATLTLGGVNTYTGATTVSTGTLLVNGSLASSSAVSVTSAATLGGTGTINGATTLAAGSFLAPGASSAQAGKLNFGSTLNMSGATLNVFIKQAGTAGADYSQVAAAGATTITGGSLALTLDAAFGSTASVGQQFTILTSGGLTGTLTQGSSIVATVGSDTYTFGIDYGTITANALTLTLTATSAIPEPASYAALTGGVVLAGLMMRRKSRKV